MFVLEVQQDDRGSPRAASTSGSSRAGPENSKLIEGRRADDEVLQGGWGSFLPPGDQHTNRAHCVAEPSKKTEGKVRGPRARGVEASYMHGSLPAEPMGFLVLGRKKKLMASKEKPTRLHTLPKKRKETHACSWK